MLSMKKGCEPLHLYFPSQSTEKADFPKLEKENRLFSIIRF